MGKELRKFINDNMSLIEDRLNFHLQDKLFTSNTYQSNQSFIQTMPKIIYQGLSDFIDAGSWKIKHVEDIYILSNTALFQGFSFEWLILYLWEIRDSLIDEFNQSSFIGDNAEHFHKNYEIATKYFDDLHFAVFKAAYQFAN